MNNTSRALASPLANRTYQHLYLAQISALTGTFDRDGAVGP
jgi:hypothetical protein